MITFRIYNDEPAESFWFDNFLENNYERFVILGGRNFKSYEDASWWDNVKSLIHDMERHEYPGEALSLYKELSRQQRKTILKECENCRYSDDTDFLVKILNILYLEDQFKFSEISGYSQGDYAEVVFKADFEPLVDSLSSYYFNKLTEVERIDEDEDSCWDVLEDSELWALEQKGNLKEELLSRFGYPKETKSKVLIADGYIRQIRWKEVV